MAPQRRKSIAVVAAGAVAGDAGPAAVPPPILPPAGGPSSTTEPAVRIPDGFLQHEALATRPLQQAGVRWTRTDEPDLPPVVSPCGTALPSDAERVGGRQVA